MIKQKSISFDERNKYVAREIKNGHCPFGNLKKGQNIIHCPLGLPGCGCADELQLNPYLQEDKKETNDRTGKNR